MRVSLHGLAMLCLSCLIALAARSEEELPGRAARDPIALLLVQLAQTLRYDGDGLTLVEIGPTTLFFADRPQLLQGHLPQDDFEEMWEDGWNRYAVDPPNAALQILEPAERPPILIELEAARFQVSRSLASLTYSLALVAITLGVLIGHRVFGLLAPARLTLLLCYAGAAGFLVATWVPSLTLVWLGYSLIFGLANGLG